MALRIGIGGFLHETNTFAPSRATLAHFEAGSGWPPLMRGEEIFSGTKNVNVGISGFIAEAASYDWDLLPTAWAAATPSAHVCKTAYETIASLIVEGLQQAAPLDGVYLDLHGAMVAEHLDDGEGELLSRVRAALGNDIPLVVSLDLHANVTEAMVRHADMLIAYRTYPHVDMADTGRSAARKLAALLDSKSRPAKAFRRVPFLIPINWQSTDIEPARGIYARLREMEGEAIPSLSFAPGFPAADFPECGPSIVAYGADEQAAASAADDLLALVCSSEDAFDGRVYDPDEGVREAMRLAAGASKPVVISDTQDNPGAGGNSDTTGMLRALVKAGAARAALGVICDPAAAKAAHEAGLGAEIRIALGGKSSIPGDAPFEANFTIEALSGGQFLATGPFYGRGARLNLGPSACLRTGGVRVAVASRKAQLADQAMYRYVGIEPTEQAILVNKSSVHFRADFAPIAAAILVCAAPGPMPADPSLLPWTRLAPGIRMKPNGLPFSPSPAFRRPHGDETPSSFETGHRPSSG
jgi:microcystin degradation protein MlrC